VVVRLAKGVFEVEVEDQPWGASFGLLFPEECQHLPLPRVAYLLTYVLCAKANRKIH